jgi:hypothetical protein
MIEFLQLLYQPLIHLLPKQSILQVKLGPRNRIIQLQTGVVLLMIVHGMDRLVEGERFG